MLTQLPISPDMHYITNSVNTVIFCSENVSYLQAIADFINIWKFGPQAEVTSTIPKVCSEAKLQVHLL